jgi:hypothetical protein
MYNMSVFDALANLSNLYLPYIGASVIGILAFRQDNKLSAARGTYASVLCGFIVVFNLLLLAGTWSFLNHPTMNIELYNRIICWAVSPISILVVLLVSIFFIRLGQKE